MTWAEQINHRIDGRIEWICEHGCGHTIYAPPNMGFTHGCCGCCNIFWKTKTIKNNAIVRKDHR